MHAMYKSSNTRKDSEDEAQKPLEKIDDATSAVPADYQDISGSLTTGVPLEKSTAVKDNRRNLNLASKNLVLTSDIVGERSQSRKSTKKERSSSHSTKTSAQGVLTDDSGTSILLSISCTFVYIYAGQVSGRPLSASIVLYPPCKKYVRWCICVSA